MKKSIRILSLLMAFAMLIGSFTVMGSAYEAYKGTAIKDDYNDVDSPVFSTEQYASMALDELDRMLAKEKMVVNIFIGTLDLSSVDTTLNSVKSLLKSVETLLPLLGDAADLANLTGPIDTVRRTNTTDLTVIYGLLDFIANLEGIVYKYVSGNINLGILDSFIADFKFDVRELAIGLVYGFTNEGKKAEYDYFDEMALPSGVSYEGDTILNLGQTLLNEVVLGEWVLLNPYFDDKVDHVEFQDYDFGSAYTTYTPDSVDYYGWVHPKQWVTIGLGGCVAVAKGAAKPAPMYDVIDVTTDKNGYDFIEALMRRAYDYILVPVLNDQTRPWLRKLCGFTYDEKYSRRTIFVDGEWVANPDYDPNYQGYLKNGEDSLTIYADLFNYDAYVPKATIDQATLVDSFNTILGKFLEAIAKNNVTVGEGEDAKTYSWSWDYSQGNDLLFDNICNVGKFVVLVTDGLFFSDNVQMPEDSVIEAMSKQEICAFILREILNNSVDYIYVDDTYTSLPEVGYRAVEQLAWQDIPQYTYTKPEKTSFATVELYYDALVDKMIDILFDIAVYNLNQGFDMVPALGADPINGAGLLQYQGNDGSYETNLLQMVAWAVSNYGKILALDLRTDNDNGGISGLTIHDVWKDLDTIIDSLIPIVGGEGKEPWISGTIAGNGSEDYAVSKAFIFEYLLKPIYYLDATNFATIFERNENGAFSKNNGVAIIMTTLNNVFDLIAPGVFDSEITTVDGIVQNTALADMLSDFIQTLGTQQFTLANGTTTTGRGAAIAEVALPIVCMLLHLSDDQEFEEMEIYMPETISTVLATDEDGKQIRPSFQVVNGSSGINTGYTDKNGAFSQDNLYTYEIKTVNMNTYEKDGTSSSALSVAGISEGTTIAGGDSINVTINGNLKEGQLVEFIITYLVKGEDGTSITGTSELKKTVFAYVGKNSQDDDAVTSYDAVNGREVQYEPSIYLSTNDDLDDIEGYSIRIKDNKSGAATASVTNVSFSSSAYPFLVKNADTTQLSASMTGEEGIYFLNPFDLAVKTPATETEPAKYYERFEYFYQKDEDGNLILDDNGDPIKVTEAPFDNGGVPNGEYTATTTLDVAGTAHTVTTHVHLFDDFGLVSLFNNSIAANRQITAYDTEGDSPAARLFGEYETALKNAARLVLQPKVGTDFSTAIEATAGSGYVNKYEELATALEAAIEALEPYELNSGTSGLRDALADYSGLNYTIAYDDAGYPYQVPVEYYEANYKHFGMRDYVPHTYNRYREARDRVTGLINSQDFFVVAPFEEGYTPTQEETDRRNESITKYEENMENRGVIGSIEETYALHMLDLTGKRLIRLMADKSKLQEVYDICVTNATILPESNYTVESYTNYINAKTFTEAVLAEDLGTEKNPGLRPSKVNTATTELMYAWKELAPCADYTALDRAVANALATTINSYGEDAEAQTYYTKESYQAFLDAYNAAKNLDRDLSEYDQDVIDEATTTLIAAGTEGENGLVVAKAPEVVVTFADAEYAQFYDNSYTHKYAPGLEDSTKLTSFYGDMSMVTLADGSPVDGVIVGYGVGAYDEATASRIFANSQVENGSFTITPNNLGIYSTDSVVRIYDNDGVLKYTYLICLRGDVNGDADINTTDSGEIMGMAVYADGYLYQFDPSMGRIASAYAADVNNDYSYDLSDMSVCDEVSVYMMAIDQVNGGIMS